MTDLIKRDDALAAIDTFKRDFEQSWKVQFSADIKALPAVNPAAIREAALQARIEELVKERDEARHLQSCACNYDTPTDVCMGHHALFERLYAAERGKLEARIEELEKELDETLGRLDYWVEAQPEKDQEYCEEQVARQMAEAKLAKAVAGLRKIGKTYSADGFRLIHSDRQIINMVYIVLAELEKKE